MTLAQPGVVLMHGLGCDSTTLAHLWATQPDTRRLPNGDPFDLNQLIVLTSQTLGEWAHTAYLNETYLYPVLAEKGIRTVQIMRAGPSTLDGYLTLDDTRQPQRCWIRGRQTDLTHALPPLDPRVLDFISAEALAQRFPGVTVQPPSSGGFGLADELLRGATVPQFGESRRQCSPKFKHQGQDQWVMDHALGYGLSQELMQVGGVPQFSGKGQLCQNHFKADPASQWLDHPPGYGLAQDLIEGGIVPQFVQNRRRCSAKFKTNACEQWLGSEHGPVPEIFVAIGFTVGEERRRERGDLADAKRASQAKPSWVKRTNFYPLIDQFKLDRTGTEAYAQNVVAKGIEPWWRSACVYCPFSGIAGPKEEVLFKHRQCPEEAGFALLIEHLARRLNPKQTLYPQGRSLFQMLKDDGNQAALDHLQAHLEALPWAIYRVQRIVGSGIPWRKVELLAVEGHAHIETELWEQAKRLGGELSREPDGFLRAWIEQRHTEDYRIEDLLTMAPALAKEKHRPGWEAMWAKFHAPYTQPTLF
ncbi:hypothetical protein GFS31_41350 (plasmid) [Leptolyngbya sp. BL0902]|uniref:hypothetical protein n=1 Tax=Leptolyngbya sp. BL0902 TaxID=1115757 RepID=UPI0018E85171|nr:hypothetical protein [Leptolyngbya sp. BL0902]QQE67422.1 hypothetical protein GFS31_41350 [Leptolyngbya sp. BL0902]